MISMTNAFRDNVEKSRFELERDGQVVFADYKRRGASLLILHVEAPQPLRGTGAASALMQAIAEKVRAEGGAIVPYCGYAVAWLRRHKEFQDLVT